MFEDAKGDVKELAHDGASDSELSEFALLEQSDPGLERSAPFLSHGGRQIKGFAQKGVADFAKMSLAIEVATRKAFCRSQTGIGSQLSSRVELFTSKLSQQLSGSQLRDAGNRAKQLALAA